jgi:hypothetical protein
VTDGNDRRFVAIAAMVAALFVATSTFRSIWPSAPSALIVLGLFIRDRFPPGIMVVTILTLLGGWPPPADLTHGIANRSSLIIWVAQGLSRYSPVGRTLDRSAKNLADTDSRSTGGDRCNHRHDGTHLRERQLRSQMHRRTTGRTDHRIINRTCSIHP